MPSRARQQTEAVARGFRRADAPARCRCTCFQRLHRPQQEKRQAGIHGGEMQLLAGLEIEFVDHSRDGLRRGRTQGLRHGPQGFFAMRRLDHDQAVRIETEAVEAVSIKAAIFALLITWRDEDERVGLRQAGKTGHHEAEGGWQLGLSLGNDLVQCGGGQAALRQAGIKRGKPEGQGIAQPLRSGQQAAQFLHDRGAAMFGRKDSGFSHLAVSHAGQNHLCSVYVPGSHLRTNREHCQEAKQAAKRGAFVFASGAKTSCPARKPGRVAASLLVMTCRGGRRFALLFGFGRLNCRREKNRSHIDLCRRRPRGNLRGRLAEPRRYNRGFPLVRGDRPGRRRSFMGLRIRYGRRLLSGRDTRQSRLLRTQSVVRRAAALKHA